MIFEAAARMFKRQLCCHVLAMSADQPRWEKQVFGQRGTHEHAVRLLLFEGQVFPMVRTEDYHAPPLNVPHVDIIWFGEIKHTVFGVLQDKDVVFRALDVLIEVVQLDPIRAYTTAAGLPQQLDCGKHDNPCGSHHWRPAYKMWKASIKGCEEAKLVSSKGTQHALHPVQCICPTIHMTINILPYITNDRFRVGRGGAKL